jgi:hypothetical protein
MSPDEIKLGYLLLNFLCLSTRDRSVNKFNVIGRSRRGVFEMWLEKDVLPIWVWDELKRARRINATGTDLVKSLPTCCSIQDSSNTAFEVLKASTNGDASSALTRSQKLESSPRSGRALWVSKPTKETLMSRVRGTNTALFIFGLAPASSGCDDISGAAELSCENRQYRRSCANLSRDKSIN